MLLQSFSLKIQSQYFVHFSRSKLIYLNHMHDHPLSQPLSSNNPHFIINIFINSHCIMSDETSKSPLELFTTSKERFTTILMFYLIEMIIIVHILRRRITYD